MNKKLKNVLLIAGPLAVGVGVILWVNRKKNMNQKNIIGAPNADGISRVTLGSTFTNTSSYFPLKQGSNNAKVKDLQKALGVTPDGIFGPLTETALFNLTGSRIVASQADFNNIVATAQNSATAASNLERANSLLTQFNTGNYNIIALKTSTYSQVMQDAYGALNPTGQAMQVPANKPLSRGDYQLTGTTKNGNLLIQVTSGDLAGLYTADPTTLTLVAVGDTVGSTDSSLLDSLLSAF